MGVAIRSARHARTCATAVRFDFYRQRCMTRILLCFERFAQRSETPKEIHAMRHQNSVFHSLTEAHSVALSSIRSVEKYGADELVAHADARSASSSRCCSGNLAARRSLREIVTGMASHETRLYHAGAAPVKRSTMSDANTTAALAGVQRVCRADAGRKRIAGCDGQPQTQSGSLIPPACGSPA